MRVNVNELRTIEGCTNSRRTSFTMRKAKCNIDCIYAYPLSHKSVILRKKRKFWNTRERRVRERVREKQREIRIREVSNQER